MLGVVLFKINWMVDTMFGSLSQLKYGKAWDTKLNEILDGANEDEIVLTQHTLQIGNFEIWIGNKYYSYGNLDSVLHPGTTRFMSSNIVEERPSLKTMYRLSQLEDKLREKDRAAKKLKNELFLQSLK